MVSVTNRGNRKERIERKTSKIRLKTCKGKRIILHSRSTLNRKEYMRSGLRSQLAAEILGSEFGHNLTARAENLTRRTASPLIRIRNARGIRERCVWTLHGIGFVTTVLLVKIESDIKKFSKCRLLRRSGEHCLLSDRFHAWRCTITTGCLAGCTVEILDLGLRTLFSTKKNVVGRLCNYEWGIQVQTCIANNQD